MQVIDNLVFEVPHGSDTEAAIDAYFDAYEKAAAGWREIAETFSADGLFHDRTTLMGLQFENGPPDDTWMQVKGGRRIYRPRLNQKTEAARQWRKLTEAPSSFGWLKMLGLDVTIRGNKFKTPGATKYDGTWYLIATTGCPVPDDVVLVQDQSYAQTIVAQMNTKGEN